MHKNTRLLPCQRRAIYGKWLKGTKVVYLARQYEVSRPTIYKIIKRARLKEFFNRKSVNHRFMAVFWGLSRLEKTAQRLAARVARKLARSIRYEKTFPGEMVHVDNKILPHLEGETQKTTKRERLYVAIDDYSRELFADILPDKTQYSGALFLEETIRTFSYPLITLYSDNGGEFKGGKNHEVSRLCKKYGIGQQFTKPRTPRTNGKAERVIKTLLHEWFRVRRFTSHEERRQSLYQFVDYYNRVRPHQGIKRLTPLQRLTNYFSAQVALPVCQSVNNA